MKVPVQVDASGAIGCILLRLSPEERAVVLGAVIEYFVLETPEDPSVLNVVAGTALALLALSNQDDQELQLAIATIVRIERLVTGGGR